MIETLQGLFSVGNQSVVLWNCEHHYKIGTQIIFWKESPLLAEKLKLFAEKISIGLKKEN